MQKSLRRFNLRDSKLSFKALVILVIFSLSSLSIFMPRVAADEFSISDYIIESIKPQELEQWEDLRPDELKEIFPIEQSEISLPKLVFKSKDADRLNAKLAKLKKQVLANYEACMNDQAIYLSSGWTARMITDQLISVQIESAYISADFDFEHNVDSFIFNLDSGKQLSDSDLLSVLGLNKEQAELMLAEAIVDNFGLNGYSSPGGYSYNKAYPALLLEELWEHDWERAEESSLILDELNQITFRIRLYDEDFNFVNYEYFKLPLYLDLIESNESLNPDFVYLRNYLINDYGQELADELEAFIIYWGEFTNQDEREAVQRKLKNYEYLTPFGDFLEEVASLDLGSFEDENEAEGEFYLFIPKNKTTVLTAEVPDSFLALTAKACGTTLICLPDELCELELSVRQKDQDFAFTLEQNFQASEFEPKLALVTELEGIFDSELVSAFGQAPLEYAFYWDLSDQLSARDLRRAGLTNPTDILALPAIDLDLAVVDELEADIAEIKADLIALIKDGKYAQSNYWISEEDGILSVICVYSSPEYQILNNYLIYNIDLETGERLSDLELLNRFHSNSYAVSKEMYELARRDCHADTLQRKMAYLLADNYWEASHDYIANSIMPQSDVLMQEFNSGEEEAEEHHLFITPAGRLNYFGRFAFPAGSGWVSFAPRLKLDLQAASSPESSLFLHLLRLVEAENSAPDAGKAKDQAEEVLLDEDIAGLVVDLGECKTEAELELLYRKLRAFFAHYTAMAYAGEVYDFAVLNFEQAFPEGSKQLIGDNFYLIIPREEQAVLALEGENKSENILTHGPTVLANSAKLPADNYSLKIYQVKAKGPQEIKIPLQASSSPLYEISDIIDFEDFYIDDFIELDDDYTFWSMLKPKWLEKYLE
ncbi:MAG: hypothetical protein Q4P08_03140 [Eubacteriales bacterium]|nr:hypothetical protein [Eubacteriales bacterium]